VWEAVSQRCGAPRAPGAGPVARAEGGALGGASRGARPPSAVRRLARSDSARVLAQARAPRTGRLEHATGPVDPLMGPMGPPPLPQGGKRIRYDGGPATQTFVKGQGRRQVALAKVQGVSPGAVKRLARLPSRHRAAPRTGREPFRGPHGQGARAVGRLWPPT
jgi:hypothetical protein